MTWLAVYFAFLAVFSVWLLAALRQASRYARETETLAADLMVRRRNELRDLGSNNRIGSHWLRTNGKPG